MNKLRTLMAGLVMTVLVGHGAAERPDRWGSVLREPAREWLRDALVPGMSVAVIEHGRIAWQGAFGVKNAETGEPVTADTVFEAASMSKPVFAYMVLKLAGQGKLDLDRPLAAYFKEDSLADLYPAAASSPDPRWKKITARMVLTHRTGFPNWFRNTGMRFLFEPGERFSYSGEGFSLLGAAVAAITGRPLEGLMQELVFDPLQMKSSSYVWRPDYEGRFTAAHGLSGQRTGHGKQSRFVPGASLCTTAGDYARFLIALAKGTGLKASLWREMLKIQVAVKDNNGRECFFWGLGVGLHRPSEKITTAWHWGDNGDLKAYFEMIPEQKRGVVVLMNGCNAHAISPLLVRRVLGIERPAISTTYFDYPAMDSPELKVLRAYRDGGPEEVARAAAGFPDRLQTEDSPVVVILMALTGMAAERGDPAGAAKVLELILQNQPGSIPALIAQGGIRLTAGDQAGMEESFRLAMQTVSTAKDQTGAARAAEASLNDLGYRLLNRNRYAEAITVFTFNAESFPGSANVFDSLAEAYRKSGNKAAAKENYKKALAVDPEFQSAKDALRELEQEGEL